MFEMFETSAYATNDRNSDRIYTSGFFVLSHAQLMFAMFNTFKNRRSESRSRPIRLDATDTRGRDRVFLSGFPASHAPANVRNVQHLQKSPFRTSISANLA